MQLLANEIYFSKKCEFWFSNEKCAVPLGDSLISDLEEAMNDRCGDTVTLSFRTNDRHKTADIAKFTKRINAVSGWVFSEWQHPVVKGFTNVCNMECVATRSPGTPSVESVEIRNQIAALQSQVNHIEQSSGTGHDIAKLVRLREKITELQFKLPEFQFV